MTNNNNIIVAHIGGRSGSIGFPENPKFSHEIEKIIFEADEDCLEQIKEIHPNSKTLNFFVGKNNEQINFNLNYCPYTSSTYNLNKEFENFYHKGAKNTDYVFKHVMSPKKKINLCSRSLESLSDERIIDPPDYLSIDTQGSEFEILSSSKKLLKNNILAVNCEVSFSELYLNSKLFTEIHQLLIANDFFLVSLETIDIGFYRIPTQFRGKGIPLQGEALYLKKPDKVKLIDNNNIMLKKLAFIAISLGYTEYAYKILEKLNFNNNKLDYEIFLMNFYNKVNNFKIMPKLWNDVFSFKESLERFNSSSEKKKHKNILIRIYNKIMRLININNKNDLSFVNFLKSYGFHNAAKEVKSRAEGKL